MCLGRNTLERLLLCVTVSMMFTATGFGAGENEDKPSGFAVVELFTSQGCSSCPPADVFLGELAGENTDHVYPLSFHVTYWDYLGWRDPYAKEAFSRRQRDYTRALGERTYTPQTVINGAEVMVGSDRRAARIAIEKALRTQPLCSLKKVAVQWNGQAIRVDYILSGSFASPLLLSLVVVEKQAGNRVKRGENRGRSLNHANVALELETVEIDAEGPGHMVVRIPEKVSRQDGHLLMLARTIQDPRVIGAAMIEFPATPRP